MSLIQRLLIAGALIGTLCAATFAQGVGDESNVEVTAAEAHRVGHAARDAVGAERVLSIEHVDQDAVVWKVEVFKNTEPPAQRADGPAAGRRILVQLGRGSELISAASDGYHDERELDPR